MTREQVKKLLPIMQAYAEGKTIQIKKDGDWLELGENTEVYFSESPSDYRIKQEPKYRPFKTQEECWQEMQKHQPFGFIVNKYNNDYCGICRVFKDEKGISGITLTSNSYSNWDMEITFDRFTFADGTPFGVMEE